MQSNDGNANLIESHKQRQPAMTTKATKTPPIDTGKGEMHSATLALNRMRAILDKADLTPEWKHWLVNSLVAGLPVLDEDAETPS